MPRLKDLDCSIELSDSSRKLQEFGTSYGDGFVETFVAVPSKPQSFSIHLTSNNFIAPGISMYVFVDGVYQCNRNRQDLKLRKGSDSRSLVDFRVRQKEEKQRDGSMIAREWKFEKLDTTSADDAPDVCSSNILDNIGCIEVLVLRCAGQRTAKTVSAMNMDGADDMPSQSYGMDGKSDQRSIYDDRGPSFNGFSNAFGPPPPMPGYRAPYAENVRSHDTTARTHHSDTSNKHPSPFFSSQRQRPHSRFSEPISPGARPPSIPSGAYQYGSGSIPTGPMPGSEKSFYAMRPTSAVVTNRPAVDPKWLNEVLTEAVKRGVEESRREAVPPVNANHHPHSLETSNQPPGAWPQSPAQPLEQLHHSQHRFEKDKETTWGGSQGWAQNTSHEKGAAHVSWDTTSESESWAQPDETESDTWDTEDTWESKSPIEQRSSQWSRSRAPTVRSSSDRRPKSSVAAVTHKSRQSKSNSTRKSRSKSRSRAPKWEDGPTSSSEDRDGWTHVEAAPDSPASWEQSDDTLQPSQSRSQLHSSRARIHSRKPSKGTRSAHSRDQKSSRRSHSADKHVGSTWAKAIQSPASKAIPTVMNAPSIVRSSRQAPTVPPRRPSRNTEQSPANVPTPLTWGSTPSDARRKESYRMAHSLPAPFSIPGNGFTAGGERRSTSSSSLGDTKKDVPKKHTKAKAASSTGWEEGKKAEKDVSSWVVDDAAQETQDGGGWGEPTTKSKAENQWEVGEAVDDGWNVGESTWDVGHGWDTANQKVKQPSVWATDDNVWDAKKDVGSSWPAQETTRNDDTNKVDKPNAVQWNDNTAWTSAPIEQTPPKPPSTLKRHTNKSLSKYRQLRSTVSDTGPKSHWQFPPSPSAKSFRPISEHVTLPPEPRLKISSKQASEKGVEHQVRAGPGSQYGHMVGRPEYLDTLGKPYAVFRFKYRSRAVLKSMFGDEVPDHGHLTTHTHTSKAKKEKEKLKEVPKDELIEKMLKLQTKLAEKGVRKESKHKEKRPKSVHTESVARDLTENWVKQHSREASEQGKEKKAKCEKKGGGDGWNQAAGDGGWGGSGW